MKAMNYSSVNKNTGTIGKVKKHTKVIMTESILQAMIIYVLNLLCSLQQFFEVSTCHRWVSQEINM